MATNTVFFCKECGYESAKRLGKCPPCNSWNSFYEQKIVETKNKDIVDKKASTPQKLNSYEAKETLYHLCMRDFEDNKQTKDEKYCICFGENYFNTNGDVKIIKKECGKLPKFLEN